MCAYFNSLTKSVHITRGLPLKWLQNVQYDNKSYETLLCLKIARNELYVTITLHSGR